MGVKAKAIYCCHKLFQKFKERVESSNCNLLSKKSPRWQIHCPQVDFILIFHASDLKIRKFSEMTFLA